MAVNIHITIIELNALHTKRQNLFQELDAVIHLLMEAKHWGLRKSRNATSLNSRFKSLDTLKVKIISVTFRRVIRTNHKKASKIWRHENIQLGGCQSSRLFPRQIRANTISFTVFPEIVPSIGNSFINTMKNINHTKSSISDDIRNILCSSANMRIAIPLILRLLMNYVNLSTTLASHFFDLVIGKILTSRLSLSKHLDRKSGSAGMPRPISYAVFCLKKKNTKKCRIKQITFRKSTRTLSNLSYISLTLSLCTI